MKSTTRRQDRFRLSIGSSIIGTSFWKSCSRIRRRSLKKNELALESQL